MEELRAAEIAAACKGSMFNCKATDRVCGVVIDSRKVQMNDLFVAIKGEQVDGHDFIEKAMGAGTALVLSEKDLKRADIPYILVENTVKALQDLAVFYKSKFKIPFVAVTGSSGKTTTKDMIAAVLEIRYRVLKTEGNFNNEIGLPLTLFRLDSSHQLGVLEMGMSSLGEIHLLADMVRPDFAVITNVGTAHIENLKTRENIMRAKLEITDYFGEDDVLLVNGDNDLLKAYNNEAFQVVRFGMEPYNDLIAFNIIEKGEQGIDFDVMLDGRAENFTVPLPGRHNVYNALAAIHIARALGMNAEEIRNGLLQFKPSKMRMDIFKTQNGLQVINDVYNANPESMAAALGVLKSCRNEGNRCLCVLGDMLELGDYSREAHYNLGRQACAEGIDVIMAVGAQSGEIARGALDQGAKRENIHAFKDNKEAMEALPKLVRKGDTVLVKGSRGMKMEQIVDLLRERG